MSGHKQQKKQGSRREHATKRRHLDFEAPVLGSVTAERGIATSNFTDGGIAGADHRHDAVGHVRRGPATSEPRRRSGKGD